MGNHFVLKDNAGRAGGYLLLGGGVLRCRVDASAQKMTLTAGFEDGKQETYDLQGGGEQAWPCAPRTLLGGVVAAQGRTVLSCGRAIQPASRTQTHETLRKPPEAQEAEKAILISAAAPEAELLPPQRRWPPPPCMPQATYAHGRWEI